MNSPLGIDLYCGLGGWTEGLIAEGFEVVGFDIERHDYGAGGYPAQLVLQDVLTLHGSQFKDAALIVASPPCQNYSYLAMPWSRSTNPNNSKPAKALRKKWETEGPDNRLFDACFRIQREACEASGRLIPLVVENVRGAIPLVGQSRWAYGSFHFWGDVPALMPSGKKLKGFGGTWFHNAELGTTNPNRSRTANPVSVPVTDGRKLGAAAYQEGVEIPIGTGKTSWFFGNTKHELRGVSSGSHCRKAASAQIARIPLPISRHIARCYYPMETQYGTTS